MNPRPMSRRTGLIVTAGLLAFCTAPAIQASAAQSTDPSSTATKLAKRLGTRSAGAYLDHTTHKLVVTVTSGADAKTVRAAGATAKTVARSGAQLRQATGTLGRTARVPGTAWSIDPRSDQVVVSVDSSVTGANLTKVTTAAKKLGSAVRVQKVAGKFRPLISGGDPIYGGGYRCSVGFNVTDSNGTAYFLTAGHCGNDASSWTDENGQQLGDTQDSRFPSTDYAIVRYAAGVDHPSNVDLYNGSYQSITQSADAYVGESVQRSGSTSGVHGGTVTGLDATVNYAEGTVYGLIDTNVCAEPGDSGGSLFDGSTAVGLTSGGSGDCSSGGETFFQPVTVPLSTYGVHVG